MATRIQEPVDGATATAHVAYFMSDAAFIFPITPSSPMAEQAHAWSMADRKNAFGQPMMVRQMQSEGGSAGALHGSCSEGAISTTFTSSQGLLLMVPNMYKIAGELLPCVIHLAARTIATEALSIFGDHTDVYASRGTGFAFLCSGSVQECVHMAAATHTATLKSCVPFAHFFDGFRTSHEIQKIDFPSDDDMRACMDFEAIKRFRNRGLNPEHPVQRGTAQNPDVFFQIAEAVTPYYARVPAIVEEVLATVNKVFGKNYKLFEYNGHPEAEHVVVCMGSSKEVVNATVDYLVKRGQKVGCINVRLYRPFSAVHFLNTMPKTVKRICVLDRGRDPHAVDDPLHADICGALMEPACTIKPELVIGGRYGLSSKDFNPDMTMAIFKNLAAASPKNHFTVGINDDVSGSSLDVTEHINALPEGTRQCLLWGIGGDGTIGANKTAIKLIADNTDMHAQGYFSYDANKSGGLTLSHLRFGPTKFEAPYLVSESDYVACHNTSYIYRFPNLISSLKSGGNFVLNCPWRTIEELEANLPAKLKIAIAQHKATFYCIDANKIARDLNMGPFINMVLQSVFFYLSNVLDVSAAIGLLKTSIKKMYSRKGDAVVQQNVSAVDKSLDPSALVKIAYPESWAKVTDAPLVNQGVLTVPERLKKFNEEVFAPVAAFDGDSVPVSKMPAGGEMPTGTSQLSKRGIAENVPHWHEDSCIQCNQCAFVCPHSVIRSYQINEEELKHAPENFATIKSRKEGHSFRINVSALDCTGCAVCAETCPKKCLEMLPLEQEYAKNKEAIKFVREEVKQKPELGDKKTVIGMASNQPLIEFPGSCGGCGETPLVRLVTQMFGDRMVIAAATGCNSIWGGSFPLVPYCQNERGEGPAWHNSLFEDGAELGFGIASGYRQRRNLLIEKVRVLLASTTPIKGMTETLKGLLTEWMSVVMDFEKTRALRDKIKPILVALPADSDASLKDIAEPFYLDLYARTSFWIIGGDGWAYDIGYGGLDHVIANQEDINILVLDTEVYSNTGGQRSKATHLGAQAKFAVSGKETSKKDLGRMAMAYESCYVASIAQGADMQHSINCLREAEAFNGPSIVIAYTPCMEHHLVRGMKDCMKVQKLAVETGYWILYRFNPDLSIAGKNPFQLDCKAPSKPPKDFLSTQGRFVSLEREQPEHAKELQASLSKFLSTRFLRYQRMSGFYAPMDAAAPIATPAAVAPGTATKPTKLQILFASETGNSEKAAKFLQAEAKKKNIPCDLSELDSFDFAASLAKEPLIAICTSSSADGIPSNGSKFWNWLENKPRLDNTAFAMFGLGDSSFPEYLRIPKRVHAMLHGAGAKEFHPMGDGDENKGGFIVNLEKWAPEFIASVSRILGGAAITSAPAPAPTPAPVPAPVVVKATPAPVSVPVAAPKAAVAVGPYDEAKTLARAEELVKLNKATRIAPNVFWLGATDYTIRDFHGIQTTGSSYNCYLILGAAPTLIDTVKEPFADALIASLKTILDPGHLRYIVINHAEPDHASALPHVLAAFPNAEVVCTPKCKETLEKIHRSAEFSTGSAAYNLAAIAKFAPGADSWTYKLVKTGDTLSLGKAQTLWFCETSMVHWPESTMTYLVEERLLFTMDAFGQHYASTKARFDDELSASELAHVYQLARSYFANILMPFGKPIIKTLEKLATSIPAVDKQFNPAFDASKESVFPRIFATAHGMCWRKGVDAIVSLYKRWAAHETMAKVVILYDTMYGSTERMARAILQGAMEYRDAKGNAAEVQLILSRDAHPTETADAMLDAACFAFGSPALNNEFLPSLGNHMTYLKGLRPEGRTGLIFGSYGWGPSGINNLAAISTSMSIAPVVEPIYCQFAPDQAVLERCYEAGKKLAQVAVEKGKPYPF